VSSDDDSESSSVLNDYGLGMPIKYSASVRTASLTNSLKQESQHFQSVIHYEKLLGNTTNSESVNDEEFRSQSEKSTHLSINRGTHKEESPVDSGGDLARNNMHMSSH